MRKYEKIMEEQHIFLKKILPRERSCTLFQKNGTWGEVAVNIQELPAKK
jgi:hypothetical protein